MIKILLASLLTVSAVLASAAGSLAEDAKPLSLDSLLGKYEGRMQIHAFKRNEYDYQVEIAAGDKSPEVFTLESYCRDCETKVWKRDNCRITDAKDVIKFTCKGKSSEEEFTFKDGALRGSGHTSKRLHSISVTKVVK
jgi:hypothetical protein